MTLRVFRCEAYNATLTPSSCARRYAPDSGKRGVRAGPRIERVHCHDCAIGAAHAKGRDAAGVEYSDVDTTAGPSVGSVGTPVPKNEPPTTESPMPESRPTRPCEHPNCGEAFTPTHNRSLYCDAHRTPAAAAERKALRDEVNAALEAAVDEPGEEVGEVDEPGEEAASHSPPFVGTLLTAREELAAAAAALGPAWTEGANSLADAIRAKCRMLERIDVDLLERSRPILRWCGFDTSALSDRQRDLVAPLEFAAAALADQLPASPVLVLALRRIKEGAVLVCQAQEAEEARG
jgi:hypothetical protein